MNFSAMGQWMQDVAVPFLMAMGAPAQGGAPAWVQFVPFALVLGIFYFVILLPMKRKQQKVDAFLGALKVGDRVVTVGRHLRQHHRDQRPGRAAPDCRQGARADLAQRDRRLPGTGSRLY